MMPATECSRISSAFLEEEHRVMGDLWFASEYLCQFVNNITSALAETLIERAFGDIPALFAESAGEEAEAGLYEEVAPLW